MTNVYKYLGSSRIGFLKDGLIRFTPPGDLNDPYECLPGFPLEKPEVQIENLKKSIIKRGWPKPTDSEAVKKVKIQRILEALQVTDAESEKNPYFFHDFTININNSVANKSLGIFSLSRRWNSCLMWSHYTDTYRGFCVGFDRRHDFFSGKKTDSGHMHPLTSVNYADERIIIPQRQEDTRNLDVFLTKSKDWAYEEEERVLSTFSLAHCKKEQEPFPIHLFQIPLDAITEIVVGHKCSDSVKRLAHEAGAFHRVPVFETFISFTTFDVERRALVLTTGA